MIGQNMGKRVPYVLSECDTLFVSNMCNKQFSN